MTESERRGRERLADFATFCGELAGRIRQGVSVDGVDARYLEDLAALLRHGEREPDAWIHENAVTAMRTGADQTMVYADRGGRDVPVYFGYEPDVEREAPRRPTDAEIDDACMWYRHDYGLLDGEERDGVRFDAVEWLRAWIKVRDGDCPGWDHRAAPTAQEEPEATLRTTPEEAAAIGRVTAERRTTVRVQRSTEGEAPGVPLRLASELFRIAGSIEATVDNHPSAPVQWSDSADLQEAAHWLRVLARLAARTEPGEDRLREAERLLVNASFPHAADCLRRFGSDCSCDSESLRAARRRWLSTTEET